MGSNDAPGDYRNGGCTACHVTYANDRSPVHSGEFAKAGNLGMSQTTDEMIPKDESGHPIKHVLTKSIPTSQCMTCHMHPGTNMLSTYQGLTWWDNETDGDKMYPAAGRKLSDAQRAEIEKRNPEGSALRGLWSDPAFPAEDRLARVQRAAETDAVRRLPRPRLAVPSGLQTRSQGAPARRAGQSGEGLFHRSAG